MRVTDILFSSSFHSFLTEDLMSLEVLLRTVQDLHVRSAKTSRRNVVRIIRLLSNFPEKRKYREE